MSAMRPRSVSNKRIETKSRYYTWSPYPVDTDLEFVPMLWGPKSLDQFASTINDTINTRSVKAVLGMNECEHVSRSPRHS